MTTAYEAAYNQLCEQMFDELLGDVGTPESPAVGIHAILDALEDGGIIVESVGMGVLGVWIGSTSRPEQPHCVVTFTNHRIDSGTYTVGFYADDRYVTGDDELPTVAAAAQKVREFFSWVERRPGEPVTVEGEAAEMLGYLVDDERSGALMAVVRCEGSGPIVRSVHHSKVKALVPAPAETLFCCPECGCTEIQMQHWLDPNTGENHGMVDGGNLYCPECDATHGCAPCPIDATGWCEKHGNAHGFRPHPLSDEARARVSGEEATR